ncbi:hypothetical protein DFH07DRAFT_785701 [Mycena maculata]|uniref:Uncharacterized protein n=1 Tax=Mycena maculata TaxID=230809 RepID=A0AAD7H8Z2_9AGAR|nr:hypothetical protein DFH07DRAFT_785701 [Mycena maculata]
MVPISIDGASFVGCVLESMLYGAFTIMAGFTLKTLLAARDRNRPLTVVLCLIWIFSTAHWITNVYRAYNAFIRFPEGPVTFYNTLSLPSYTARNTSYYFLTLVADGFAVTSKTASAARDTDSSASTVAGGGVIYTFTKVPPGNVVFIARVVPWITSWISMTLATNVVCTIFIAIGILRIHMAARKVHLSPMRSDPVWTSVIILTESAAIYSSTLITLITCYLLQSNSQYILLDLTVSSIGITFTMIILRISLKLSSEVTVQGQSTSQTMRVPVRPGELSVNVSRLVQVNSDQYLEADAHRAGSSPLNIEELYEIIYDLDWASPRRALNL